MKNSFLLVLICLPALSFTACFGRGAPYITLHATPTENFPETWEGDVTEEHAQVQQAQLTKASDDQLFAKAKVENTVDSYVNYLAAAPTGQYRSEAAGLAVALANGMTNEDDRNKVFGKIFDQGPEGPAALPSKTRLLLVGPVDMRVSDLLALHKRGLGTEVLASKILSGEYEYKDFSLEELSDLKDLGLPDPIVKAMLEATAKVKEKSETDELKTELARLAKLVEQQQSAGAASGGGTATAGAQTIETTDGTMDVAACMAAKLGAMQLCQQIPWPGSTVCKTTAESNFPCN